MKKFLQSITIVLLCGALCTPVVEARGRNNGAPGSQRPAMSQNRPGNSGQRPGANSRPGNNNRPAGQPANNNRPGTPSANRPVNPQPGNSYQHYYRPTAPARPHLPAARPYSRPLPPAGWRPVATWRPFTSILGVALGTAINLSLNSLINAGYTITSYGNNAIYLSNVPMLNFYWPDATMYYNNGMLAGSEFIYSTPYNDPNRYNAVYNSLCGAYGTPVSLTTTGGITTASWWGTGNQFIRLTYGGEYAGNGGLNYYTTLTFGI